jgi:hypothetical protein
MHVQLQRLKLYLHVLKSGSRGYTRLRKPGNCMIKGAWLD